MKKLLIFTLLSSSLYGGGACSLPSNRVKPEEKKLARRAESLDPIEYMVGSTHERENNAENKRILAAYLHTGRRVSAVNVVVNQPRLHRYTQNK